MGLFHVSEGDNINIFEPRILERRKDINQGNGLVWAVSEGRLYNFLFPRECPRISTFKTDEAANFTDMDYSEVLVAVEKDWMNRIGDCKLFIYEFDSKNFNLQDECAGYYVSKHVERPIGKRMVDDCLKALDDMDVDVIIVENLWELRDEIYRSSPNFSFCKMGNAIPRG